MPLQIIECESLATIEGKIAAFETRYEVSSEVFLSDAHHGDAIPEFHALEWEFLLMQKKAMLEDDSVPSWGKQKSAIMTVDVQAVAHDVAA